MGNTTKNGEVINFFTAKREREKKETEQILEPAKAYCINYNLLPKLKRLDSRNLDKVLGYTEALLYVQDNAAGKSAFEEVVRHKEQNVIDLKKIEDVRTYVYKAQKAVRASGKRLDYILPFFRQVFRIAEEILRSDDFEILDIHTVRMSRSAVSRIKEIRQQGEMLNDICDGKDILHSWRIGDFPARLVEEASDMMQQILKVDST